MNPLASALAAIDRELSRLDVPWALVGGLAVSVRGEPRMTRDIDVALALETQVEEDRLVRELGAVGYRRIEEGTLWQESVDRLATLRLQSPVASAGLGILVDLIFASSGIESEIVLGADRLEVLPGLFLPVAQRSHLIALKVLADRHKDRADLVTLLAEADAFELDVAREALRLIESRGFHRGRALEVEFEQRRTEQ